MHLENRDVDREKIYTVNVVVTGRCNAACTYCHFYATRNRKEISYDMSDDLFVAYMKFIGHLSDVVEDGKVSYRFSGGDPMVLKKRLFTLADEGYRLTGIRPFVLTAGKALNRAWVQDAKKSAISHIFVSIENPIAPDPKAPNPHKVAEAIRTNSSADLPIIPGVCVVPNTAFKHLYEICEWFYTNLGVIPIISEVNYAPYTTPTEAEWAALEDNLSKVVKDFFWKTPLNLFYSAAPELAYGWKDPYLSDLNLENSHGITCDNYQDKVAGFLRHLQTVSYPSLSCNQTTCPWHVSCTHAKWYWTGDEKNTPAVKLRDYCRMKRLVSDVYYRCLADPNHPPTGHKIDIAHALLHT